MTAKLYRIQTGRPSWHQSKAGGTFAGEIILRLTDEELQTYWRNHAAQAPHEPIYVYEAEEGKR